MTVNPLTPTAGRPAVLSSAQVSSMGEPTIALKRYGHPRLGVKGLTDYLLMRHFTSTMSHKKVQLSEA